MREWEAEQKQAAQEEKKRARQERKARAAQEKAWRMEAKKAKKATPATPATCPAVVTALPLSPRSANTHPEPVMLQPLAPHLRVDLWPGMGR